MAGGDRTAKPAMEEDPGMPRTRPSCLQRRHFRAQIINPDPDLGGILGLGTELMAAQDRSLVALLGASAEPRRPRTLRSGYLKSASRPSSRGPVVASFEGDHSIWHLHHW